MRPPPICLHARRKLRGGRDCPVAVVVGGVDCPGAVAAASAATRSAGMYTLRPARGIPYPRARLGRQVLGVLVPPPATPPWVRTPRRTRMAYANRSSGLVRPRATPLCRRDSDPAIASLPRRVAGAPPFARRQARQTSPNVPLQTRPPSPLGARTSVRMASDPSPRAANRWWPGTVPARRSAHARRCGGWL